MLVVAIVAVIAIVSWAAVVTAGVTSSTAIAGVAIAASLIGLTLLVFDAFRARERRKAESATGGLVRIGARYPDYGAFDRAPQDALIHDDHEVDREIMREERVLHSDTGPRQRDISGLRARETIADTHFRWGKDHGGRS
jgi:hypothetical protein